jgi:hypothetical protein
MNAQTYTQRYDAMVREMTKAAPAGSAKLQWVAGALRSGYSPSFWDYFLNSQNHAPGTPIDWISAHYYGGASSSTNESTWWSFFTGVDTAFAGDVAATLKTRDALAPHVKVAFNEVGIFIGGGGNQTNPNFPPSFWNAAAAQHVYMYIRAAQAGLDSLGMSQLVANPPLVNWPGCGGCTIGDQYASVAILDWNTGNGTARYWALKLLIDHAGVGDALHNTTAASTLPPGPLGGPPVFGQALVSASGVKKLLLLNKDTVPRDVEVAGAAGATALTVDFATGFGPPRSEVLADDTFTMDKFAVMVLLWA